MRNEDVETYRAAYLKDLEGMTGDLPTLLRRSLDAFPPKDTFPAVTEIRIDAQGRIWVRTFDRPGSTATVWLSFADTGAFICSLSVPRDLTVFHFESSTVVAVHRDEMDIESVEIRSFSLPEG